MERNVTAAANRRAFSMGSDLSLAPKHQKDIFRIGAGAVSSIQRNKKTVLGFSSYFLIVPNLREEGKP